MGSLVRTDANNAFCRLFSFHVKPRWKSGSTIVFSEILSTMSLKFTRFKSSFTFVTPLRFLPLRV